MSDHDGHTINVGPVTIGGADAAHPVTDDMREAAQWRLRNPGRDHAQDVLALCGEVDRLRDLLAKAFPWIDPNESHDDYLLTVAIREALGEGS